MWESSQSVDIEAPVEQVQPRFTSTCQITALEKPRLIAWQAWVDGVTRTEWEFRLSSNSQSDQSALQC